MDTWSLEKSGFDPQTAAEDGSRFLCANGYMGLRGTVEEAGRGLFPAITMAGVYDRRGDLWREPVNAPNALFAQVFFNGRALHAADAKEHRTQRSTGRIEAPDTKEHKTKRSSGHKRTLDGKEESRQ